MSLKTILVTIEETAVAEVEKIGGEIIHAVLSDGQIFVAKLREMPIGAAVMNTIELLEETGKPGAMKFSDLVEKQGGALLKAAEQMGGWTGIFSSFTALGNEFFNTVVNDFKAAVAKA